MTNKADSIIMDFPHAKPDRGAPPPWRETLGDVVARLQRSREVTHNIRHDGRIRQLPSAKAVAQVVDKLAAVLFPTHYGEPNLNPDAINAYVDYTLAAALTDLSEQVLRDVEGASRGGDPGLAQSRTDEIVTGFAEQLPAIRNLIVSDLLAAYAGDPAATSYPEIMLSYPGMTAVLHYRIARALYLLGATLVARLISQSAHTRTAIDIHPGAEIGESFFVDHGTGVVIGETTVIGDRVRLYQGVTLGARSFKAGRHRTPRQGTAAPSDRGGRRCHLCRRDHPGPDHHRAPFGDRRQCVADRRRVALQQRHAGAYAEQRRVIQTPSAPPRRVRRGRRGLGGRKPTSGAPTKSSTCVRPTRSAPQVVTDRGPGARRRRSSQLQKLPSR